jgi:ethanolamine utilization protein EutM
VFCFIILSVSIRVNPWLKKFTNYKLSTIKQNKTMPQAIGMIETRGLVALVEGTDAMLKAANVELIGPMMQVGNALVTACVVGDVAAVKAATDAGAQAIKAIKGELVSVHVIARPHADVEAVLPKKK